MMAPSEDFWNLQSKFRGKKEFNFYDKMVPQPFKITPSPTPTPSVTLTPTPTPSYDPCNIYNSFCFHATDSLAFINGIYYETSLTGSIDLSFVSGSTWSGSVDCSSSYAVYTGTTEALSTGVWMFDSGGDYQFFELKTGSLGCGNSIDVIYQLVEYTTPDVVICDGIIYAAESSLEGYITYGGVCPTPTTTPTISLTPSITATPLPNDSPSEIDQDIFGPTSWSTDCFSLSGYGYIQRVSLSNFQFVYGVNPEGNKYSYYTSNSSPNNVIICRFNDAYPIGSTPQWRWVTARFLSKTTTGWTNNEVFPSGSAVGTYTDNITTNNFHYPSSPYLHYNCGVTPTPSMTPFISPTPTLTPGLSPSPTPTPVNANGFKITNSSLEGGDMNGTYILAKDAYFDEYAGSSGGLFYHGWVCINTGTSVNPYGNLYKNINDDRKFINVESFNGGNVVRLYKGDLTSQLPSDPDNPFSCDTRLYNVSRDYGYGYAGEATTYCGYSFPLSGSTSFGDVEWLNCIP